MSVPSPIRKFIRRYINSEEGSQQVSNQAPVQFEGDLHLAPEGTDPDTILDEDGDIVFLHEE